jgi:hypothetical protein
MQRAELLDRLAKYSVWLTLVNLELWWVTIRRLDETQFDDLGVVNALPAMAIIGPLVAIGLVALCVGRGLRNRYVVPHVVALTVMLYGIGAIVGNTLQARIVLRHEGIADSILRTGTVDPTIDAYFNWPGFFSFLGYARQVTGVESFDLVSLWAPVLINLLYIAPILLIAKTVSKDERIAWATVVVFLLGNWVGQDYLSPQAVSYALYLTILAALLIHARLHASSDAVDSSEASAIIALVIILFAATVPSHQLTPIVIALSVTGLVLARRSSARGLPLLMGALLVSWLVFMSATYLQGNIRQMLDLVGDLGAARDSNVTERLGGSVGHRKVVRIRLAFTGAIALLAGLGWLTSILTKRHSRSITVLAAVPVTMMFLQPYGGEMILRVFFFSLPFLAFYVVTALPIGGYHRARIRTVVPIAVLAAVAVFTFQIARYGNARLDIFTDDEEDYVAMVYDTAPPGSLILAAIDNLPWKDRGYELFDHETIDRRVIATLDSTLIADAVVTTMYSDRSRPAYFIATDSQQTYVELLGGLPLDALATTESRLRSDPSMIVLVDEPTIRVYELPSNPEATR